MEITDFATAAYGVSWIVEIALELALLGVALVAVRPTRPEIATLLAISALIALASSCLGVMTPVVAGRAGVDALLLSNAASALVGAALHALSFGLILLSIVRLLRPRRAPPEF